MMWKYTAEFETKLLPLLTTSHYRETLPLTCGTLQNEQAMNMTFTAKVRRFSLKYLCTARTRYKYVGSSLGQSLPMLLMEVSRNIKPTTDAAKTNLHKHK
jgi:hypothetical protein